MAGPTMRTLRGASLGRDPLRDRRTIRGFRAFVQGLYLRFHMSLLLGGTAVAGVAFSRVFLDLGVAGPALRLALGVACAYGVFFLLVRAWLAYVVASALEPEPGVERVREARTTADRVDVALDGLDAGVEVGAEVGGEASSGFDLDLDGVPILVVLGVLLGGVLVAGWLVWQGPVILLEAAFELALASGLVRAARRLDGGGWVGSVLRATIGPFLVVLALAIGAGLAVEHWCPGSRTVPGALAECRK